MPNEIEKKTLYLVATPIGNLSDITNRALKTLAEVDFIAAEDTRVTAKLLERFEIKKSIINYFEHNKREVGEKIVQRLLSGEACALVTDAGTPAISDPGEDLCRLCHENGIRVVPIPGACAAVSALCASGLDTRRFTFIGFLPMDNAEKKELLSECAEEKKTMIFYEAPHRLLKTLAELKEAFGNRSICVARELTKLNEEIISCTFDDAIALYTEKEPRGEFVLIISGKQKSKDDGFWKPLTVKQHVDFYIQNGLSKMDAMKAAAKDRGVSKNTVYKELL